MYIPEKILTNAELEEMVDTSDDWILTRTGITERRIAADYEAPSDLATNASREALIEAELEPSELDLIIICTSTPDVLFPSTACFVQKKLGAGKAAAFDISAVCSGFVFGLSIAEQFLKTGRYNNILIAATEINSRIVDWKDRSTCVIFGDGSGAAVLKGCKKTSPTGVLSTHIYSDGNRTDLIEVPGGIGRERISKKGIDDNLYVLKMDGGPVFKLAVRRMSEVAREALERNGLTIDDVNLIIPHQANRRILNAVAQSLNISEDKFMVNIDKYGNTSAASIPIALHEARQAGRIKSGDHILLTVLGAGLTWGAALIKW
tara:strand:- start:2580 stop:3536 length:957 start_codon:yes stop_codon:yes gene_type:complete